MDKMRWVLKAFTFILILSLTGALLLECLDRTILSEKIRRWAEKTAAQATGRKVSIGRASLNLWHGFLLERIAVAEDPAFGETPFLEADRLTGGILFLPLVKKREFLIPALRLVRPRIRLLQNPDGRWNFQTIAWKGSAPGPGGGSSLRVDIPQILLSDGTCEIRVGKPAGLPAIRIENLNLDLHLSLPAQIQGSVTGAVAVGRFNLEGRYLAQEHRLALQGHSSWQSAGLFPFLPKQAQALIGRLEGPFSLNWEASGRPRIPDLLKSLKGTIQLEGLKA